MEKPKCNFPYTYTNMFMCIHTCIFVCLYVNMCIYIHISGLVDSDMEMQARFHRALRLAHTSKVDPMVLYPEGPKYPHIRYIAPEVPM